MTTRAPRIAVLIAVHNRRELTLRALRALHAQGAAFALTVVIFDDGSTDGTAEAVRAAFPDTRILQGDGTAWWNGALHAAWNHARTLEPDGYLWLNDDVALDPDALTRLRFWWDAKGGRDQPFILAGAMRGSRGEHTYGGFHRRPNRFRFEIAFAPVSTELTAVDLCAGNCVLIPAATVERIGVNWPGYVHERGDFDYGLRATRAGIGVFVIPGTVGVCEVNTYIEDIDLSAFGWAERWRRVQEKHGHGLINWWRFTRRHCGIFFPLVFLRRIFRLMIGPGLVRWRRQLRGVLAGSRAA